MNFIDEKRKVYVRSEGNTWVFKAVDGSVIEKPAAADEGVCDSKKIHSRCGRRNGF